MLICEFIVNQEVLGSKKWQQCHFIKIPTKILYNEYTLIIRTLWRHYILKVWNTANSVGLQCSIFLVSYGVKQGGIISPILFNVYMDQLSEKLMLPILGEILVASWLTIYIMQMIYVKLVCHLLECNSY